jgi:hypothetical protein
MKDDKTYYKPRELIRQGYPAARIMELARKIGRKSDPEAEKGFHYLLTLQEVRKELGY